MEVNATAGLAGHGLISGVGGMIVFKNKHMAIIDFLFLQLIMIVVISEVIAWNAKENLDQMLKRLFGDEDFR